MKELLLEKGERKKKETEGRPSKEKLLSKLDNGYEQEQKHNTQSEVATSAGVGVGTLARAEVVRASIRYP